MNRSVLVAQLSDPHLTEPRPANWRELAGKRLLSYLSWVRKRRSRHPVATLAAVVADLAAARPDHVLVTGDLTQLGLASECDAAAAWLRALGPADSVSAIPGNHDRLVADDWSRTTGRWRDFCRSATDASQVSGASADGDPVLGGPGSAEPWAGFPIVRQIGAVALVGVDSAVPTPPLFASGRVGAQQLARLGEILQELGRQDVFRLVYLHHSPLEAGHAWRKRLRDAAALTAVVAEAGAELVVHGHGHYEASAAIATAGGNLPVIGAPSASLVGDGRAGWNLYRIDRLPDAWQLTIERRRWRGGGMVLAGTASHRFPVHRGHG